MQIGISTAAFYGKAETEQAAQVIGQMGADCMEAFLQCHFEHHGAFGQILKDMAGKTEVRSIHVLSSRDEPGLFSKSLRQRQAALETLCGALDAGQAAGARYYVLHGQAFPKGMPVGLPNYDRLAECIEPLVNAARARGIWIAWENVWWSSFRTPKFAVEMAKRLPEIRFTLDIKQAAKTQYGWRSFLDAMGERLVNVHVCDEDEMGALCLPGRGKFDFDALAQALRAIGYQDAVILEPYPELFDAPEQLIQAAEFLKAKFDGGKRRI